MGPNYFCWQPICYVTYDINSFAWQVEPRSYEDLQLVIDTIMKHKHTFDQYRFVAIWFDIHEGREGSSFLLVEDAMTTTTIRTTRSKKRIDILPSKFAIV